MNKRGCFIVLYGPNNLGKSAQLDELERVWQKMGRAHKRLKYPIYGLPTGQRINAALREGVSMNAVELQALYAQNRRDYQPILEGILNAGIDVLAEDYKGTGMAWGETFGVPRRVLEEFNGDLRDPDVAILLDGERFTGGIEKEHRFEAAGDDIWERNREVHRALADEYGWRIVEANGSIEEVHMRIMGTIIDELSRSEYARI